MPKSKNRTKKGLVRGPNSKGSFRVRPHSRKDGSQCLRWSGYIPAHKKKFWGSGASLSEAVAAAEAKISEYQIRIYGGLPLTDPEPIPTLQEFIENIHFKSLSKNRKKETTMQDRKSTRLTPVT